MLSNLFSQILFNKHLKKEDLYLIFNIFAQPLIDIEGATILKENIKYYAEIQEQVFNCIERILEHKEVNGDWDDICLKSLECYFLIFDHSDLLQCIQVFFILAL